MPTLVTRAHLLERYGPRLTMEQLASVLGRNIGTLRNMLCNKELPIKTYREGNRRFASYEAVADYLDDRAEKAKVGTDGDDD